MSIARTLGLLVAGLLLPPLLAIYRSGTLLLGFIAVQALLVVAFLVISWALAIVGHFILWLAGAILLLSRPPARRPSPGGLAPSPRR
ncbi:MAG: hypothetical protein ACNA7W_13315 [Pseudomonadales bacterium]